MSSPVTEEETQFQEVVESDSEPDFEARCQKLMTMIETEPKVRDRMLVEMYIFVTDFERAARTMALNGGPMAIMKAMLGKGKNNGE